MEKANGWWFPDKESHLPKWLEEVKKRSNLLFLTTEKPTKVKSR